VTALITIRQAGAVITCDRGCYNAKHANCDCQLCGGVNHGIGLERATANTRRLAPKWVEAAGEGAEVELDPSVQQDPLFTIGDDSMSEDPAALLEWREAGCSRTCRDGHTRKWGGCAYGIEPAPTLQRSEVLLGADGYPSLVYQSLTVEQVADWLREQGYTVGNDRDLT
jgi:hypothetical protein